MTRRLDAIAVDLDLDPDTFAGVVPTTSGSARWTLAPVTTTWEAGDRRVRARGDLPSPSPTTGTHTIRTPVWTAAALRAWDGVELWDDAPTGSSVTYRTWDGTTARWWNGAAWAAATLEAHWSTRADVEAHFATHPTGPIAFTAKLAATDPDASPVFLGARVGARLRHVSAEREALGLVVAALRALRPFAAVEVPVSAGATAAIALNGGEWGYDWTAVDAAFLLSAEGTEIAGAVVTGTDATWTPSAPLAASGALRIEGRYALRVEVRRHRDLAELPAAPVVVLAIEGVPSVSAGEAGRLLRRRWASPPTAIDYPAGDLIAAAVDVRVHAELADDVREIAHALRAWLGVTGYRRLVSADTGRAIAVRELAPIRSGAEGITAGMPQGVGTWEIRYVRPAAEPAESNLVATVTATAGEA